MWGPLCAHVCSFEEEEMKPERKAPTRKAPHVTAAISTGQRHTAADRWWGEDKSCGWTVASDILCHGARFGNSKLIAFVKK